MPSVSDRPAPLEILYEDRDLLVLNKPAGISVHPSAKEPSGTLTDAILSHDPAIGGVGEDPTRPGIVHRLDKDTSGVLLVAKNQRTFEELKALFQKREVEKRYLAIVEGKVKEPRGTIALPIGRAGLKRTVPSRSRRRPTRNVREAETSYVVRKRFKDATLLELRPKTGRMHQIRVHLQAIGHPVLGDKLYGGKRAANRAARQMLHAYSLTFSRSNGKRYTFEADPPPDFQEKLDELMEESEGVDEPIIEGQ
jgi:23S rRNA pseudouridine1911/1915/1917 synthase